MSCLKQCSAMFTRDEALVGYQVVPRGAGMRSLCGRSQNLELTKAAGTFPCQLLTHGSSVKVEAVT
jgi:hypothetical protein